MKALAPLLLLAAAALAVVAWMASRTETGRVLAARVQAPQIKAIRRRLADARPMPIPDEVRAATASTSLEGIGPGMYAPVPSVGGATVQGIDPTRVGMYTPRDAFKWMRVRP